VTLLNFDVRFTPESGHSPVAIWCLLWANSRHSLPHQRLPQVRLNAANPVAFFFLAIGGAFGVWLPAIKSRKTFFPITVDRKSFHSLLIVPIKQNSLIFSVALTLHHVMVTSMTWPLSIGSRKFDAAARAAKKR
jgi:hypothetical protein